MSTGDICWPSSDTSFAGTPSAKLYGGIALRELALWTLVVLPASALALLLAHEHAGAMGVVASCVALTFLGGHIFLWGPVLKMRRRGVEERSSWREQFDAAREATRALERTLVHLPQSAPAQGLWNRVQEGPRYVCALSSQTRSAFSPRSVAPGLAGVGATLPTLRDELVRSLLSLGGSPVLLRDADERLTAIWQLDRTVQFWAIVSAAEQGSELRVDESSGYQWWLEDDFRSGRFMLASPRRLRRVRHHLLTSQDDELFRSPKALLITLTCEFLPLVILASVVLQPSRITMALLPPIVALAWWLLRLRRASVLLSSFAALHDPALGDSLDLALIQRERAFSTAPSWSPRYLPRSPAEVRNLETGMPCYEGILHRIDVQRELVTAAVTQAMTEAVNSRSYATPW